MNTKKVEIKVYGMLSTVSEKKIEQKLSELKGILTVLASFDQGSVSVEYDSDNCSMDDVVNGIISAGYSIKSPNRIRNILIMAVSAAILAIVILNPMKMMMKSKSSLSDKNTINVVKPEIKDGKQIIRMTADGKGYTPNVFYIQKNVPVKWIIDGKQITSCNNQIVVPAYKIKQKLKSGENVVEFTPNNNNDINFSCWMGMISGVIKVVDNINSIPSSKTSVVKANQAAATPAAHVHEHSADGTDACEDEILEPGQGSILGNDLSKVSTDKLVKKAQVIDEIQTLPIKGIGGEFDPPIIVVNKNFKVRLGINLNLFEYPMGTFSIIDYNTKAVVSKFQGEVGIIDFEYTFKNSAAYVITKDKKNLTIIVVVDDVKTVDLETIRNKYLK